MVDCPKCTASKFTCDEHFNQYSRNRIAQVEVKLSPPNIVLGAPLPGWADDRLRQAYALIDDVMDRLNSEDDAFQLLKTAAEAVEDADCELEKRI